MAPISFARGAPAPECLDAMLVSECARAVLERDGTAILSYGTGGGYGPLRELLGERHDVDPARVFVTTGGLQGFVFYSAVQLARRPGRVLVEAPTYDRPLKLLRWQGVETVAIAMDDEGLDPDALEAELGRGGAVSFLYTIPTFQNPSGRTLGEERRRRIAELVSAYDLECARGRPVRPRPLRGGRRRPRCTRSRAASASRLHPPSRRPWAPGLRVGWFVVPDGLSRGVRRPRRVDVHLAAAPPSKRSSTSSSHGVRSSRTSSACGESCARSGTRCSPR